MADAMTNIGMNFQGMQSNFDELKADNQELKYRVKKIENGQNRIEQKLDPTIDRVDEHSVQIAKLNAIVA